MGGLGGASLLSSGIGALGNIGAAGVQANAAGQAAQTQLNMYNTTRGDLSPYNQAGQAANTAITNMGSFDFQPTQAQLEATPGYQFNLSQGLKSTQNSYAARGLGTSGAAMKGAASYASGLADTTYQNQFSNALTSYNTNLARLQGQASLGENAAAQTGNYGTQAANAAGQAQVGAGNAWGNGISGATGNIGQGIVGNAFLGQNQGTGIYGGASAALSPGSYYDPGTALSVAASAGL
jgi:hypothetical protein